MVDRALCSRRLAAARRIRRRPRGSARATGGGSGGRSGSPTPLDRRALQRLPDRHRRIVAVVTLSGAIGDGARRRAGVREVLPHGPGWFGRRRRDGHRPRAALREPGRTAGPRALRRAPRAPRAGRPRDRAAGPGPAPAPLHGVRRPARRRGGGPARVAPPSGQPVRLGRHRRARGPHRGRPRRRRRPRHVGAPPPRWVASLIGVALSRSRGPTAPT